MGLAGTAFFLAQAGYHADFEQCRRKLKHAYKPYEDRGGRKEKTRHFAKLLRAAEAELQRNARTREQCVRTAKVLFELADGAVRVEAENTLERAEELEVVPEFVGTSPVP
jgi:hypothetical protein